MLVIPIPANLQLAAGERRGSLGPPRGMDDQDCATIDVIWSEVQLPSGQVVKTTRALVQASPDELERIKAMGGVFWFEVIGTTFPPVMFTAPLGAGPHEYVRDAGGCAVCGEGVMHYLHAKLPTDDDEDA